MFTILLKNLTVKKGRKMKSIKSPATFQPTAFLLPRDDLRSQIPLCVFLYFLCTVVTSKVIYHSHILTTLGFPH